MERETKLLNENFNCPMLMIAGPGTGKTHNLIKRIKYLLDDRTIKKKGIVVCTFTKKATEELKIRIDETINLENYNDINLLIGTIHSICYGLLKEFIPEKYSEYNVLDKEGQILFIKTKLINLGFDENESTGQKGWQLVQDLSSIFDRITDQEINYEKLEITNKKLKRYCSYYNLYQEILEHSLLFDYATIQKTFYSQLKTNKNFKQKIKEKYDYYFVDEYQDVNIIQDKIFKELSSPQYHLTVVGDEDQSIYGFRGSNVSIINNFEDWFKKKYIQCSLLQLNINYRSTKKIVDISNAINKISDYSKYNKKNFSGRSSSGIKPVAMEFLSDNDEARYICDLILLLKKNKILTNYNEVAILFGSVKNHSNAITKHLKKNRISFEIIGSGALFELACIKEFITIYEFCIEKEADIDDLKDKLLELDNKIYAKITNYYNQNKLFDKLIQFKENSKFNSCIDLTYKIFILIDLLNRYENDGQNLGQLTSVVLRYDDFQKGYNPFGLWGYLLFLQNHNYINSIYFSNNNSVQLMTIHQSKGLEFPFVFLPSQNIRNKMVKLVDELLDKHRKKNKYSIGDEERRKYYVGITRAEDFLLSSNSTKLEKTKKNYQPILYHKELMESDLTLNKVFTEKEFNTSEYKKRKKDRNGKKILSYNQINTYETCPLQYKFRHIWNLNTIRIGGLEFGNNIHNIIQNILLLVKSGKKLEDLNVNELMNKYWNNNVFRSPNENIKFKKAALKQISIYLENEKHLIKTNNIFLVEEKFDISVGNTLITGRFDLCYKKNENFEILDFKTGDENKNYSSQLTFYAFCFEQKYKIKNINLSIFYLKNGKKEYIKPTDTELEIKKINKVSSNIDKRIFQAAPGKHCKDCAYNNICDFRQ